MNLALKAYDYFLRILPSWEVSTLDSMVMFGGLLSFWNPRLAKFKSFSVSAGMLLKGHFKGVSQELNLINYYGPYKEKKPIWEFVAGSSILSLPNLILEGDLNLTLESLEV